MQLTSLIALLPVLTSSTLAAPLEARQLNQEFGWSVSFWESNTCNGKPSLNTTSGPANRFDCQRIGPGSLSNGTFFSANVRADMYCHVTLFADDACTKQVNEYWNEATGCLKNPGPGFRAYSTRCGRF
ncbi:MAG: hypothetical protein M1820_006575 [Bogoriella megaspora]|nr:MAG: hypothetical protein M1820_006575 [Bogoriella megaspora]